MYAHKEIQNYIFVFAMIVRRLNGKWKIYEHRPDDRDNAMMLIVKNKNSAIYSPRHEIDLPMFRHCCEGMIGVRDINFFMPVFTAHNIQIMIQDETL